MNGGLLQLKYIAMDEDGAKKLVTAMEWMDTLESGLMHIPTPIKKSSKTKKETLVLELELEKPRKKKPRKSS